KSTRYRNGFDFHPRMSEAPDCIASNKYNCVRKQRAKQVELRIGKYLLSRHPHPVAEQKDGCRIQGQHNGITEKRTQELCQYLAFIAGMAKDRKHDDQEDGFDGEISD